MARSTFPATARDFMYVMPSHASAWLAKYVLYAPSDCTRSPSRPFGRKRVSTANITPSLVYELMV